MTTRSSVIFETLQDLLAQQLEVSLGEIRPETVLGDAGLDSLSRIDFALSLEKRFNCQFEEGKILRWRTVQDIIDAIEMA